MAEMTKYFFTKEQVLNRLFVLYGNTTDCYRTASHSWLSFDRMLESHLKFLGYKVVLFYRGGKRLECFDTELNNYRESFFPLEKKRTSEEKSIPNAIDASESKTEKRETKPVAGLGGIRGRARKENITENRRNDIEEHFSYPVDIKEESIPSYLNRIMREGDVKSCIVFTNCWEIFEDQENQQNKELASYLNEWYGLPTENDNISILLFNEPRLGSLNDFLHNKGRWAFLYERIFQDQKPTDAVIRIGAPGQDEIRYMLEGFFTEVPVTDEMEQAAMSLVKTHGGKLQALRKYLFEKDDEPEQDVVEQLLSEYGSHSEIDALEKIHNTEGWEEVYDLVSRLIDEKKSYPSVECESEMQNMTNQRMAYQTHHDGHKVNMSIMLKGNPGTGKTTVTNWIAKALHQHGLLPVGQVVKVAKQNLEAGYVGQSAIRTQDAINEASGGLLLIDEAYALFRKEDDGRASFGQDVIDVFVDQMTSRQGEMAFVFAGYPEPMDHFMTSNPGLLRRFGDNIVTIPDYKPEVLERKVLQSIASNNNQGASAEVQELIISNNEYLLDAQLVYPEGVNNDGEPISAENAIEIIRALRAENKALGPISIFFDNWYADRDRKNFGNVGSALQLAESLRHNARSRTGRSNGSIVITQEDFPEGKEHLFICRKPTLSEIDRQMEDIIGMKEVKDSLKRITSYIQLAQIQNKCIAAPKHFKPMRVEPGHYLFIGNPGTGKTIISEKLALSLSGLGIIDRYQPVRITGLEMINIVGGVNGIEKLKEFIKTCEGSVVVIDEAHQLINTNLGHTAVKALLDPMITLRETTSFVFCCYPQYTKEFLAIEPGIARRIHEFLYFEDYNPEEIKDILMIKARAEGYSVSEESQNAILKGIVELSYKNRTENGGTAEKLLREIKIALGERLRTTYGDADDIESSISDPSIGETILYTVLPSDVINAFQRLDDSEAAINRV